MSAVALAAPRATARRQAPALAVVTSRDDAALVALCAKLQRHLAVVRALDADPTTPVARLIRLCDVQDAMLAEVAGARAVTRAGRRAKAALAVEVLRAETLSLLDGVTPILLVEGLARDVLAEAAP
jgi:hypothetical protein